MRRQRNTLQMKEKEKTSEKELNEREISNLCDGEFKVMVIKMPNGLERTMGEYSENVNKNIENIRKNQSELKNTIN